MGRRDYAILVLLSRLGLRVGEVAALTLDDIDWRHGEIVIRGKGGRRERLPLPADAGQALAGYLSGGRPALTSACCSCGCSRPGTGCRPPVSRRSCGPPVIGPGYRVRAIYLEQTLRFRHPVMIGDTITASASTSVARWSSTARRR